MAMDLAIDMNKLNDLVKEKNKESELQTKIIKSHIEEILKKDGKITKQGEDIGRNYEEIERLGGEIARQAEKIIQQTGEIERQVEQMKVKDDHITILEQTIKEFKDFINLCDHNKISFSFEDDLAKS